MLGAALGSALGAAAGDLGGAVFSGLFNAHEASKNRDFQEDMANTAYQRAAKDLEAAGLNRVLALGSPAATPSGAVASVQAPKLGSTGIAAASAKQQIEQSRSLVSLQRAQEDLTRDQQKQVVASTLKTMADTGLVSQQTRTAAAEASKNEVMKSFFDSLAPVVKDFSARAGSAAKEFYNPMSKPGFLDPLFQVFDKVFNFSGAYPLQSPSSSPRPPIKWEFKK